LEAVCGVLLGKSRYIHKKLGTVYGILMACWSWRWKSFLELEGSRVRELCRVLRLEEHFQQISDEAL